MSKCILTVQLDEEVVRRAKLAAGRRCTSVSRLVSEYIQRLVTEDDDYEDAMRQALALMDVGLDFYGLNYLSRFEAHDRQSG